MSTKAIDYSSLDFTKWTFVQKILLRAISLFIKLFTNLTIEGIHNFPANGPYIFIVNHVSLLDILIYYSVCQRRAVCIIVERFKKWPIINIFLSHLSTPIYISREKNYQGSRINGIAIVNAIKVLRAGGIIGIAPEGTVSTNGLIKANPGFIYLSAKAPAPIVPMVAYGQENALYHWMRMRKVPISLRIGVPIELFEGKPDMQKQEEYCNVVMTTLAKMLPPKYRGYYIKNVANFYENIDV